MPSAFSSSRSRGLNVPPPHDNAVGSQSRLEYIVLAGTFKITSGALEKSRFRTALDGSSCLAEFNKLACGGNGTHKNKLHIQ